VRTSKVLALVVLAVIAVGCANKPYLKHKDFSPMMDLVEVAYPVTETKEKPTQAEALKALQAWQANTDQSILAAEGAAVRAETVLRHNTALDTDDMNQFAAKTKEIRLVTETVGQLGVTAGTLLTGVAAVDTAAAANRAARAQQTSANAMMANGGKPKSIINVHSNANANGGNHTNTVGPVVANAETGPVTAHGGDGGAGGLGGTGTGGDAWQFQGQGQGQGQHQGQHQGQQQDQSNMNTNNNGMMPMPGPAD